MKKEDIKIKIGDIVETQSSRWGGDVLDLRGKYLGPGRIYKGKVKLSKKSKWNILKNVKIKGPLEVRGKLTKVKGILAILVVFIWVGFQFDALNVYANTHVTICDEGCKIQEAKYAEMERISNLYSSETHCRFTPYIDCYYEGKEEPK